MANKKIGDAEVNAVCVRFSSCPEIGMALKKIAVEENRSITSQALYFIKQAIRQYGERG